MDKHEFARSPSGTVVPTERGQWAFVPAPLPPPLDDATRAAFQIPLAEAVAAVGELNGIGRLLRDPYLLIRPLQAQEALTSSSMEGTYTTLSDMLVVEAGADEANRAPDTREVLNYRIALTEAIESLKSLPLSLRTLRDAHARLLGGVARHRGASVAAGQFKRNQNFIGAYEIEKARFVPPPPHETLACLDAMERFIHRETPDTALIDAALLHYQFETIHPFADGNGRVGRMLITLHLYHAGAIRHPILYLSPTLERRKEEYIDRMFEVSRSGDWRGWIIFFLSVVKEAALQAIATADRLRAVEEEYRVKLQQAGRSANLLSIVDLLFKTPVVSIPQVAAHLGVTYRAAQMNVASLIKAGILQEYPGASNPRLYLAYGVLRAISGESVNA